MTRSHCSHSMRQQGAATLVVVMVLFLVMALLAAYANRSLLFEQRIAGTFFRTSAATEAAEAGVEWTLAQLNGTAVDGACKPVDSGGQRFADRYLRFSTADRVISSISVDDFGIIDCAHAVSGDGWACRCPKADVAHSARPAVVGGEQTPSFGVKIAGAGRGTVSLKVRGCTSAALDDCMPNNEALISKQQLATGVVNTLVGLVSAVRSPPATPLVVRGDINSTGAGLGLHNTDPRSAGLLLATGGVWNGKVDSRLETVPGTSIAQTLVQSDSKLHAASAEGVFKMFMGASSARYAEHPALRKMTCSGTDCASDIEAAYTAGKRMIWIDGDLKIGSNKVLGSVNDPLLIVASGGITLSNSFELNGMLVSLGDLAWTNDSSALSVVNGIVLVGGSAVTDGAVDIVYQQAVADHLRNRMGSFVRVPGSWSDATK